MPGDVQPPSIENSANARSRQAALLLPRMEPFSNIVIYHPGAIGDVMLATPVAATLKQSSPAARITYFTHESLKPLLSLCACIDDIRAIDKRWSFGKQRMTLLQDRPELIVDLSGSLRGRLLTAMAGAKVLHYRKQSKFAKPRIHA